MLRLLQRDTKPILDLDLVLDLILDIEGKPHAIPTVIYSLHLGKVLLNGIIMNGGEGLVKWRNWGMAVDLGVGGGERKRGI